MTSDIALSGVACTSGVTPRQLVQSSSENDRFCIHRHKVNRVYLIEYNDQDWRSLRIPAVIADAFTSRVCNAVTAFSCTSLEPLALTHRATSSIAAASACWLCSRRVSTSAVAIWASVLSGTAHFLEFVCRSRQSPCSSSDRVIPNPSASTLAASRLGLAVPVSIRDMYVRTSPHLSAKAS